MANSLSVNKYYPSYFCVCKVNYHSFMKYIIYCHISTFYSVFHSLLFLALSKQFIEINEIPALKPSGSGKELPPFALQAFEEKA